mgnify:FL=1
MKAAAAAWRWVSSPLWLLIAAVLVIRNEFLGVKSASSVSSLEYVASRSLPHRKTTDERKLQNMVLEAHAIIDILHSQLAANSTSMNGSASVDSELALEHQERQLEELLLLEAESDVDPHPAARAVYAVGSKSRFFVDTDIKGGDIDVVRAEDENGCAIECMNAHLQGCEGFSFVKANGFCYLKTHANEMVAKAGVVSGSLSLLAETGKDEDNSASVVSSEDAEVLAEIAKAEELLRRAETDRLEASNKDADVVADAAAALVKEVVGDIYASTERNLDSFNSEIADLLQKKQRAEDASGKSGQEGVVVDFLSALDDFNDHGVVLNGAPQDSVNAGLKERPPTVVVAVRAHSRFHYLQLLFDSLKAAPRADLQNTIVVVSCDGYFDEVSEQTRMSSVRNRLPVSQHPYSLCLVTACCCA